MAENGETIKFAGFTPPYSTGPKGVRAHWLKYTNFPFLMTPITLAR